MKLKVKIIILVCIMVISLTIIIISIYCKIPSKQLLKNVDEVSQNTNDIDEQISVNAIDEVTVTSQEVKDSIIENENIESNVEKSKTSTTSSEKTCIKSQSTDTSSSKVIDKKTPTDTSSTNKIEKPKTTETNKSNEIKTESKEDITDSTTADKNVPTKPTYKPNNTIMNKMKEYIDNHKTENMKLYGYTVVRDESIMYSTDEFTFNNYNMETSLQGKFSTIRIYAVDIIENGKVIGTSCYMI